MIFECHLDHNHGQSIYVALGRRHVVREINDIWDQELWGHPSKRPTGTRTDRRRVNGIEMAYDGCESKVGQTRSSITVNKDIGL